MDAAEDGFVNNIGPMSGDSVYINGGYAGTVGKVKTLNLRAGEYNVEVRLPGYRAYAERVYVAPGKTIKLYPDLHPADRPA